MVCVFGVRSKKSSPKPVSMTSYQCIKPVSMTFSILGILWCQVLHLSFWSILRELSWVEIGLLLFYMCFSSFSSTLFPIGCSWLPCWMLVDQICWDLILGSLIFCTDYYIYVYVKIMWFLLLWIFNIVQNPDCDSYVFLWCTSVGTIVSIVSHFVGKTLQVSFTTYSIAYIFL